MRTEEKSTKHVGYLDLDIVTSNIAREDFFFTNKRIGGGGEMKK